VNKKINFDEIIDRKNTDCIKYDGADRMGKPKGLIPMWVADMDFRVPEEVSKALEERVKHGIYGYTESDAHYFEAIAGWMQKKHDWQVEPTWLVKTPGVVFALAMAVQAFTKVGEAVMIQRPVYHPFSHVIEENDRKLVDNALVLGDDGKYHMDLVDFEKQIEEQDVKMFILCNPHNPVGRVWTKEELLAMGEICVRKKVLVVSDEIHQDFVYKGKHQVFADLNQAFRGITITCTAPSKTFNLAGLQISNLFIANPHVRRMFREQIRKAGFSQLNTMGLLACEVAYRHGENWLNQLLEYLQGNLAFMRAYFAEYMPQIKWTEPEGTYLVWLDLRDLHLTEKEKEDLIVQKAGLWLDVGTKFGECGVGFERMNIACPRAVLEKALEQLKEAMKKER